MDQIPHYDWTGYLIQGTKLPGKYMALYPNCKRSIQITSGGRKQVNNLRLGVYSTAQKKLATFSPQLR